MASPMAVKDTSDIPTRGCLVTAGIAVVLLGVMLAGLIVLGRNASERQHVDRIIAQFNGAQGRSSAWITFEPEAARHAGGG